MNSRTRGYFVLVLILVSVVLCACADTAGMDRIQDEQEHTGLFGLLGLLIAVIMVCSLIAGIVANFWEKRRK